MKPADYDLRIQNLHRIMQSYEKTGTVLYFDMIFFKSGNTKKIFIKSPEADLCLVSDHIKYDKPETIRFEFFEDKNSKNCKFPREFTLKEQLRESKPTVTVQQEFRGFGEAEINNLVDQRFREKQKAEEFDSLKEQVTVLTKELDVQTQLVEELEEENERLQSELESKSQMRYYAGMLGDILEGIGISKDKIRKPIASLMGIDEESDTKQINHQQAKQTDSSGIVEDDEPQSTDDEKRNEVITLISDYIKNTSNQTLGNLFIIFSEIEQNPETADKILQFLQSQNQ